MQLIKRIKNSFVTTRVLFIVAALGIVGLVGYSTVSAQSSDTKVSGTGYTISNNTSVDINTSSTQSSSSGSANVSGNTSGGSATSGSASNSNTTSDNVVITNNNP